MVIFCIVLSLALLALLLRIAYSRQHFHLYPAAKTAASNFFIRMHLHRLMSQFGRRLAEKSSNP